MALSSFTMLFKNYQYLYPNIFLSFPTTLYSLNSNSSIISILSLLYSTFCLH